MRVGYDVGLGADGDWPVIATLITGDDLTLQRVRIRLRMFLGNYPLNTSVGIPYAQWIRSVTTPLSVMSAYILQTITTTPGVARSLTWTSSRTGRNATFSGTFLLQSGQTAKVVVEPKPGINGAAWAIVALAA